MKTNYTTKQKYMDAAPKWTIDGHVASRAVYDSRYMPENGEVDKERRSDDEVSGDGIIRPLLWASVLGCALVDLGIVLYFILR